MVCHLTWRYHPRKSDGLNETEERIGGARLETIIFGTCKHLGEGVVFQQGDDVLWVMVEGEQVAKSHTQARGSFFLFFCAI